MSPHGPAAHRALSRLMPRSPSSPPGATPAPCLPTDPPGPSSCVSSIPCCKPGSRARPLPRSAAPLMPHPGLVCYGTAGGQGATHLGLDYCLLRRLRNEANIQPLALGLSDHKLPPVVILSTRPPLSSSSSASASCPQACVSNFPRSVSTFLSNTGSHGPSVTQPCPINCPCRPRYP